MQKIGINQNPYIHEIKGTSPVKQANNYNTNFLNSEYATYDTFTSQTTQKSDLRKELEEVKGQRGLIDGLWDGFKNLVGMKSGSNHVEKLIEQAEKGEISQEEAQEALEKYKEGQKTCVDVFADIASGLASALIFSAAIGGAVFTGGASLAVGLGLATAVGAGVKVGIKAGDALLTGKEYTGKDLLYDTATGSINGLLAPITNGIGNTVTKTIGKKLGLKIVQEGAEEAAEQVVKQGIKQTAKNMVLNQTLDVAGGTVGKRALALGAGMAVDGALGGASDNMVRAALNGDNILKAGVEGAVGGLIMAPLIGGGFRAAGKAGRALNNKITMSKILPDGMSTKFKQGNVGDCALLSTIDGMMNNPATAKNFKKSITKTIAGDYNVRIGDQVVRVSKASLSDEMLSDKTGIRIFEQAYKQLTGNIDGGFADVVAKQFGLNPVHIANESITDELLDNLSKHQGDTVLSFGTLVDEAGSITNAGGQRHYFTIKNIDADSKMVTITSPVDTSKTIELSYDEVKALGISIDGGTIKELDLPNSVRSTDDVDFKGKKKAKKEATIISEEDIKRKEIAFQNALEESKFKLDEFYEALELVDSDIAERIRQTGDLFTSEEVFAIQEAFEISDGRYSIDDIILNRGSIAKLEASKIPIEKTPIKDIKHSLDDYVNKYVAFLEQDPQKLELAVRQIEHLIQECGSTEAQKELYRGVKSQSEIARLFSFFAKLCLNAVFLRNRLHISIICVRVNWILTHQIQRRSDI